MIGKIVKGRGFRGVLEYALQKEKGKLIWTNMASREPRGLAKEFGAIRQLKPRFKNAVFHAALSVPKNEKISNSKWVNIGQQYLKSMGFVSSQMVLVRHSDTDHDHIHIIANRIGLDGKVVSDSKDFEKQEKALRAIEKQFGLVPLEAPRKTAVKAPTQGERAQAERTGELSQRMVIQGFCASAMELSSSLEEYVKLLKQWGVKTTLFTKDNKATLKGLTYEFEGFKIASGKLGREFMAEGLAERGLVYALQAPAPVPVPPRQQELPDELVQYMRDALDSYTRLKDLDPAEQELLWRDWLMRDPQAAVAWCAGWLEGEDMGPIPVPLAQQPELTQEDKEWLDMPSPDPDQSVLNDDQSPSFGR